MSLSVVISTYNRKNLLKECLESVKEIANEIIVVDNTSSDDSVSLAKKYTKYVFVRPNNPMLNINKNFGIRKATKDWILYLDDDEKLTPELAEEVRLVVNNQSRLNRDQSSRVNGYWIPRKNIIFGKWIQHGIWWPDYQMRLFKKGEGKYPEKHVHEMLEVIGSTEKVESPIEHQNYTSVSQYLYKLDTFYTENEAQSILTSGKKLEWYDSLRMPISDFLKTFFLQEGYKDGLHGLVLSLLQAFYAEIVFTKVWEKTGFEEYNSNQFLHEVANQMSNLLKEFQYWFLTAFLTNTKNPLKKILLRIKRKSKRI